MTTDRACAFCGGTGTVFFPGVPGVVNAKPMACRCRLTGGPATILSYHNGNYTPPMTTDQTITTLLASISRRFDDPTVPAARKTDALTLLRRVSDSLKPETSGG